MGSIRLGANKKDLAIQVFFGVTSTQDARLDVE
jgi:hypothetical protein